MSALKVLRHRPALLFLRARIDAHSATAARAVATTSVSSNSKPAEDKSYGDHVKDLNRMHHVTNMDKYVLAYFGKYGSVDKVPEVVALGDIDRARWKLRVRFANLSIVLTLLGCAFAVYRGKNMGKGESVAAKRQDQHREWEEDRLRKQKQQQE